MTAILVEPVPVADEIEAAVWRAMGGNKVFVRQDDYSGRWHVYTAPHTPLIVSGKRQSFQSEAEATKTMSVANVEPVPEYMPADLIRDERNAQ